MSVQESANGQAPHGTNGSSRLLKAHGSRQSSVSRPTKASDARSIHSPSPSISSTQQRPNVSQRPLRSANPSKEVRSVDPFGLTIGPRKLPTPPLSRVSTAPQTTGRTPSVHDAVNRPAVRATPSLYKSGQSASSRSISSQVSPRRAGLGARTISPVERQRSRRNSKLLNIPGDAVEEVLQHPHLGPPRKVSGIPSPVKHPSITRSRPSPIPPVPQVPERLAILATRRASPSKGRDAFRSVSGPAIPSAARQRSATVGIAKQRTDHGPPTQDAPTSFTSPMKQPAKRDGSVSSGHSSGVQLQPLTLPPLSVHELSTPTVRRVNNMSERLREVRLETAPASTAPASGSNAAYTTASPNLSTRGSHRTTQSLSQSSTLHQKIGPNTLGTRDSFARLHEDQGTYRDQGLTPSSAGSKGRDSGGSFLNRLSLSRSSSLNRARMRKVSVEAFDSPHDTTPEQITPERPRRRLSLSWVKGKMSPFGHSASAPKVDSGTPPLIPKSFTSESLASLTSKNAATPASEASCDFKASVSEVDLLSKGDLPGKTGYRTSSTASAPYVTHIADDEMKRSIVHKKGSNYLSKVQAEVGALQARAVPVMPVEASKVALLDGAPLNLYEKGEAIDYDGKIFFTGQRNLAKIGGRLDAANSINCGYDDDRGDYLINPGDHFAYRYEIVDVLGKGSFGQVLRCIDYKTGGLVAVKVIRNKKRFHAQALVEVNILQSLRRWDPEDEHHLIKYTDHFYFRHHLCIATDLLGMNLYEYVKANDFKGCSLNVIRSFTSQILSCLSLLKKERVIHCDLKPENILLVNIWESKIKIIDFGSSCFEDQKVYTYIQSRFYRSPEVILGMSYGLPIDMWSMGCILGELLTGYPMFPGEDEQEQLACIMEVFGPPEKQLIENSTRKKLFFDTQGKPRIVVSSKNKRRKPSSKTLSQAIKCLDEAFLDFMTRCLRWNPQSRLTPEEALNHPFITCKPMRPAETPLKPRKLVNNAMTSLTPRPLPQIPQTPAAQGAPRVKAGYSAYRSASTSVAASTPAFSSPNKTPHRRVVSNLPVPRERVIT